MPTERFVAGYKQVIGTEGGDGMVSDATTKRDLMPHVGAQWVTWTPRTGWRGDAKARDTVLEDITYLLSDACKLENLFSGQHCVLMTIRFPGHKGKLPNGRCIVFASSLRDIRLRFAPGSSSS